MVNLFSFLRRKTSNESDKGYNFAVKHLSGRSGVDFLSTMQKLEADFSNPGKVKSDRQFAAGVHKALKEIRSSKVF